MHTAILSERMFKILSAHVAYIKKETEEIIKRFYGNNAGAGMDIETFFREYTTTIDNYLKNVKISKDGMDSCPLVLIRSTVEVKDNVDMNIDSYHIVLPYTKKENRDMNHASCLSPMGRALLLKPVGSIVSIQTPTDILSCEIMNIVLPDHYIESNKINLYEGCANIAF